MDVDGEMPELHALAGHYDSLHGALWVAEAEGTISGMVAVRPVPDAGWEVCRLYVGPALHGAGLGHALLDQAEGFAVAHGAEQLMLWSDTRFERAHRFYEKRSYVRTGPVRVLADISHSLEYGYRKPVDGTVLLDIAAAASASRRLTSTAEAGAGSGVILGLLAPADAEEATRFWHGAARAVGRGETLMVADWRDGLLIGAGTVALARSRTQGHVGEVQLVVAPDQISARRILRGLHDAAAAHGRTLLTVQTQMEAAGASVCRAEGWRQAGHIPDFIRDGDGILRPMALFWRTTTAWRRQAGESRG